MIRNSDIILLEKKVNALKIAVFFLIVLLVIFFLSINPTVRYVKKHNNEIWKQELIKRGIGEETRNGGFKFNKVFVVKLRGE